MKPIFKQIKSQLPGAKKHWLSELKKEDHAAIKKLVNAGAANDVNYISLQRNPATGKYWIKHFIDEGMGHWFEYQPITAEQAQRLIAEPDNFQEFVLHDWVES